MQHWDISSVKWHLTQIEDFLFFFFLNSSSVLTEEAGILGQLQLPSVTWDSKHLARAHVFLRVRVKGGIWFHPQTCAWMNKLTVVTQCCGWGDCWACRLHENKPRQTWPLLMRCFLCIVPPHLHRDAVKGQLKVFISVAISQKRPNVILLWLW